MKTKYATLEDTGVYMMKSGQIISIFIGDKEVILDTDTLEGKLWVKVWQTAQDGESPEGDAPVDEAIVSID